MSQRRNLLDIYDTRHEKRGLPTPTGEQWCGLFALATRPDARRRGHASAVIAVLLAAAAERGIERFWLQVLRQHRRTESLRLPRRRRILVVRALAPWLRFRRRRAPRA
ncbi:GNAT family N-acetyltransferase [Rathayibacter sp. VKM Ac-2878]|nr:GNAT family N-acetyltransferase [Rathayibacter sp. VKM Ac-2879]MBF4502398.1 GNAT family N-acetyltransferase [Rathayibacter sp. VKM Ac-2878]